MRILVTRAEPEASRTAEALRAAGHEPIVAPLMAIVPVPAKLPAEHVQAVALTSANAARSTAAQPELAPLMAVTAFPVGERTAAAARDAGFRKIVQPAGDGQALVRRVAETCKPADGLVAHLGGRDLAVDVAALLREKGFQAERLVVYEARAADDLPEPAADALREGRVDAVLLYSARSASLLLALVEKAGLDAALRQMAVAAMSEAVAEPLRQAGHSRIAVAEVSDEAGLFRAIETIGGGAG